MGVWILVRPRSLTAITSVLVALAGVVPAAHAATIPVTTLGDVVNPSDGVCSLREAILAVDTPPGAGDCVRADANANTISLGPGRHVLNRLGPNEDAGSTGDLDIDAGTVSLTVSGAGRGATSIDGGGAGALGDRLFDIAAGSPAVGFRTLTLTGGRAVPGVDGTDGVAGTAGQPGGAIRSAGTLSLTNVTLTDNRAGDGGDGGMGAFSGGFAGPGAPGGTGADGGAIRTTASLTLTRVTLSFNFAGAGGAGGSGTTDSSGGTAGAAGGLGGHGGAIWSQNGPVTITSTRFDGNQAGAGGAGGHGGFGGSNTTAGNGGTGGLGGRGGGLHALGAPSTISASTFTANAAGAGGAGGAGGSGAFEATAGVGGGAGVGGSGGALLVQSSDATLLNLTLVGNHAGNGGAGGQGGTGGDGLGGPGRSGGAGGAGGAGGNGGGLRRQLTGNAFVTHGTIAGNFAGAGGAGGAGGFGGSSADGDGPNGPPGAAGGAGSGGGVSDLSLTPFTYVADSILASNTGGNCSSGGVNDGGYNIAFGDATCPFGTQDPKLGPLQDNGGAVQTVAPLAGSPALDQVPATGSACPATDARGVPRPRPAGGMCDIGAVEIAPPACQPVSATVVAGQASQLQLTCTDLAGAPFTFSLLSQPAHGTLSAFDAATGRVTYTAAAGYAGADGFSFQGKTADGSASAPATLTVTEAGSGPAGNGPAGNGPAGTEPPLLSAVKVSPRRFRPTRRGGSVAAARRGTRVTFTLDRAASVRFTVARRVLGRRVGSRCVAPTRRNRTARRCVRFVPVKGSFTRAGKAGPNSFRFTGRMRKRALRPGRYKLKAKPTAAGVAGKATAVAFTILH